LDRLGLGTLSFSFFFSETESSPVPGFSLSYLFRLDKEIFSRSTSTVEVLLLFLFPFNGECYDPFALLSLPHVGVKRTWQASQAIPPSPSPPPYPRNPTFSLLLSFLFCALKHGVTMFPFLPFCLRPGSSSLLSPFLREMLPVRFSFWMNKWSRQAFSRPTG